MQVTETWDAARMTACIERWGSQAPAVTAQVNAWLARGDGVAVYVNQDLGHPDLGQPRLASWGSQNAQLEPFCETCRRPLDRVDVHGLLEFAHAGDEPADGHAPVYPPVQLPDVGGTINWRYRLSAVYAGDPLPVPEVPADDGDWDDDDWDDDDWDGDYPEDFDISDPYDCEYDVP